MSQSHTIEERSPDGRHSTWWSMATNGSALLFVHGFLGSAVATWRDFPALLLADPTFAGYDIHFYGYDSARAQAAASSGMLHAHLNKLLTTPIDLARLSTATYLARAQSFRYTKLIIVAHSLGAAVTRKALLRQWSLDNHSVGTIHLVCFGPAHAGARLRDLVKEVLPFLIGPIWHYARFRYPVLDDLRPNSRFIRALKKDTEDALHYDTASCMRACVVAFGQFERVVTVGDYCQDVPYITVADADHCSICKPLRTTNDAFKLIRDLA